MQIILLSPGSRLTQTREPRRRAVTQIWNKEQSYRVGIVFEYRDQDAYKACQALLEEHYLPAVEGLTTKVVGSRGVIVHEFVADDFLD